MGGRHLRKYDDDDDDGDDDGDDDDDDDRGAGGRHLEKYNEEYLIFGKAYLVLEMALGWCT